MALFKVYRGNENNLPADLTDGWAYFCTDSGNFYIDWSDGTSLHRTQINADYASNLKYTDGSEIAEIDATTIVQGLTVMWQDISSLKNDKIDKVIGMGLSTNDFTNELKNKLEGLEDGATKTIIDNSLSDTSENPVQNKLVTKALSEKLPLHGSMVKEPFVLSARNDNSDGVSIIKLGDHGIAEFSHLSNSGENYIRIDNDGVYINNLNEPVTAKMPVTKNYVDTIRNTITDSISNDYYTKTEADQNFQETIYMQNEAPTDATEGTLWLDMDEESAISGNTSGSSATPDWNAAEGEPGHILNRPFYSTFGEGTVLAECNPMFIEDQGMFALMDAVQPLVVGNEYTVSWNGVEYLCIAEEYIENDVVFGAMLGNTSVLGGTQENEAPFVVVIAFVPTDGIAGMFVPLDGSTSLTLSITGEVETITPVPKKYLPEIRGQKSVIINLDDLTVTGMTFAEACEMDVAELQSAISLFSCDYYETGVTATENYSIMSVNRTNWSGGGVEQTTIQIIYAQGNNSTPPRYYLIVWRPDGMYEHVQIGQSVHALALSSTFKSMFYAKDPASIAPRWREFSDFPIDGIKMVSPSGNKFLVTIDDNGVITATSTI